MPKSNEGRALFRYWVDHARLNYEIPGGLINRLHDKVQEFIRLNTGDQFGDPCAQKMQPLVARFEKPGDWKQADVVTLFDDIAAVSAIPLDTTLEQVRERTLQRGRKLSALLEKADWGEPLPGGPHRESPRLPTVRSAATSRQRIHLFGRSCSGYTSALAKGSPDLSR